MKQIKSKSNKEWILVHTVKLVILSTIIVSLTGCNLVKVAMRSFDNATMTQAWKNEARVAKVPIKLLNDHIIMPVSINGGKPLNFILDSGATTTVIFESHNTKNNDLDRSFPIKLSGAGHGQSSVAYNVRDVNIAVGELELQGASIVYLPLESMQFFDSLDEVYFDGVIGYDFLKRFPIEIDYDRMSISIYRDVDDLPSLVNKGWQSLELDIESKLPTLVTKMQTTNNKSFEVKLVLDTGYTDPISINVASSDKLDLPKNYYQASLKGMSGREPTMVANTNMIKLGNYSIENFPGFYGESSNIRAGNGVLGNKILSQFNLIFDYNNEQLFIKPNKRFSMLIPMDRSGLQVYPHSKGGYVDEVAKSSGAEFVGLKRGDVITMFNNITVDSTTLTQLQSSLGSEHDSVNLCWLSNDKENCGVLPLANRL